MGNHDFSRLVKPSHRNPLLVDKGKVGEDTHSLAGVLISEGDINDSKKGSLPYESPPLNPRLIGGNLRNGAEPNQPQVVLLSQHQNASRQIIHDGSNLRSDIC